MSNEKKGTIQKEPIKHPWIWLVIFIIILLMVPWYFPKSAVTPVIFGFPLWAFVSLVMSVVFSAFLSFVLRNYWIQDEEEAE